jgi:transposase
LGVRPGDPEAKGLVERANAYLESSFLPGRRFTSPSDFNLQLADWLGQANLRHHRALECRPLDRLEADRTAMVPLPPVAPVMGWRTSTRLARDHYVRLASNDYSVHPACIGRQVEVVADLEHMTVSCGDGEVARHERYWAVTRPSPTLFTLRPQPGCDESVSRRWRRQPTPRWSSAP